MHACDLQSLPVYFPSAAWGRLVVAQEWGSVFCSKCHLNVYNIIGGTYKIIGLKNYPTLFGKAAI